MNMTCIKVSPNYLKKIYIRRVMLYVLSDNTKFVI